MNVTQELLFSPCEILDQSLGGYLALQLTLKMNVLVLMYFPVHVGVGVCVNVSVDFGVDFWWDGGSSLAEEELLLCQVLLIVHGAHAVFLWA